MSMYGAFAANTMANGAAGEGGDSGMSDTTTVVVIAGGGILLVALVVAFLSTRKKPQPPSVDDVPLTQVLSVPEPRGENAL